MLTKAWTKLDAHVQQSQAWRSKAPFVCLSAGRGSGKTEIARRRVVRYLAVKKPWPDPMYFYALPTYAQAKRVAWRPIKALIPDNWIKSVNVNEQYIETVFGSTLYVVGMDNPSRVEGVQWDGGVVDESSDQKPGVFDLSLLPALTHRSAWCWRIGIPKRYGIGASEYKAFFDKGLDPKYPEIESYTWPSSDILPPETLAAAKSILDEKDYAEQFEASWETAGGLVFYTYSDEQNCRKDIFYNPDHRIIVGSDFNISPMSWVMCHEINGELHCFDELFINNCNTELALNILYNRYRNHDAGWDFFGDATGRARKTAAAQSDYVQIRTDPRFEDKRVFYPSKNPPIADRFASCTSLFRNARGDVRFYVAEKCVHLRRDLKERSFVEGTRIPDDSAEIGHISDALGYVIHRKYPIRKQLSTVLNTPVVISRG